MSWIEIYWWIWIVLYISHFFTVHKGLLKISKWINFEPEGDFLLKNIKTVYLKLLKLLSEGRGWYFTICWIHLLPSWCFYLVSSAFCSRNWSLYFYHQSPTPVFILIISASTVCIDDKGLWNDGIWGCISVLMRSLLCILQTCWKFDSCFLILMAKDTVILT